MSARLWALMLAAMLLLVAACSSTPVPPQVSSTTGELSPWPPQPILSVRAEGGLLLSDAAGTEAFSAIRELLWLDRVRVQVAWREKSPTVYYRLDLQAETLSLITPEEAYRSVSPDGLHALMQLPQPTYDSGRPYESAPGAVIGATTGQGLLPLAERVERNWWLSPSLLYVEGESHPFARALYNVSTGKRVALPDFVFDVGLVDAETVCYSGLEEVGCVSLVNGQSFRLTPGRIHSRVPSHANPLAIHRDAGKVAYLYPRSGFLSSKSVGSRGSGKTPWANILGMYDHRSGVTTEYPCPDLS